MNGLAQIAGVVAVLFCASGGSAEAKSRLVANLEAGKPQTVVTYGTSLTARGAWVEHLKQALDDGYPGLATVVNAAEAGMWSTWGVEHLDERVLRRNPDTVLIEFAFNDAGEESHISVEEAHQNLESMIERTLKARPGAEIILMTMNLPSSGRLRHRPNIRDYYQMYRDVARARRLMLIDLCPEWERALSRSAALFVEYIPDGLHPTAEACERVSTPAILKALGLRAATAIAPPPR
ncbi:SGNH/GDSL hydrolase family protein [Verrucomicrobiota bacterium]